MATRLGASADEARGRLFLGLIFGLYALVFGGNILLWQSPALEHTPLNIAGAGASVVMLWWAYR